MVDLDDGATRDAAEADPAMFVSGSGPVCIDEYQHVPLVLDAMKAELNRDGRPGRGPAWPHWAAELSRRESTQILACLCEHLTGTEFTVRCAGRSAASPKRAELGTDGAVVNV